MAERRRTPQQRQAANRMFWATLGVVTGEVTRTLASGVTYGQALTPVPDVLIHDTGDFGAAFVAAQVLDTVVLSKIGNDNLRRGLDVGIPFAGMLTAEVPALNHLASTVIPLLGNADPKQIPAGIVGLAAWYALNRWLNRDTSRGTDGSDQVNN